MTNDAKMGGCKILTDATPRLPPMSYRLFALTALLISVSSAPTHANPYEHQLKNGLRVIVMEDHRAPTVVHMVWYRAGAMDEKDGDSGTAHALEHLMFKGTKSVGAGEFDKRVAATGGNHNAGTSRDYTNYYQVVPKAALAEVMALEADRMKHLAFDDKQFASEIKVVMEERRLRTDDNPLAQVNEALRAAAFSAHPYRRPVIGWMNDLENMSAADARAWYQRWYAPNNAFVVVVGDVTHDEVFNLAEKNYGKYQPVALPVRKPQTEPVQKGLRRVVVKAPADQAYLMMAWKVPALREPKKDREPYALEVLSAVLDGHDAARLAKNLVRGEHIAQSASAGYDGSGRGEALFVMAGRPAAGKTVEDIEAALRGEIKTIADSGISDEELARVKIQLIAAQVYKRDSLTAQAREIGGAEAAGFTWRDIDVQLERLKTVTAGEVQAAAKHYFVDDHLTIAVLDPQPIDPNAPNRSAAGFRH